MVQPLGILGTELETAKIAAGSPTYAPKQPSDLPAGYPVKIGNVDVLAAAREDIAKQKGENKVSLVDLENKFDGLMLLRDDPELNQEKIDQYLAANIPGVTEIGTVPINPSMIKGSKNAGVESTYYTNFIAENAVPKGAELPLAFSSADYKEVRLPPAFANLDPMFKDVMTSAVSDSQDVARIVTNVFESGDIPLKGQEVLLNGFATGNFQKEFSRAMRNLPGDTARGFPDFAAMIYAAGRALWDQTVGDAPEEDDIYASFNKAYRGYSLSSPRQFYEGLLNKSEVFDSAYLAFNRQYKEMFYAEFDDKETADDAWFTAHADWFVQNPKLERVVAEDGTVSARHIQDENGVYQYEDFKLPQGAVRQLLDLAFLKLPATEKGIIYMSSMAPITGTFTVAGLHKGGRYLGMVERGRKLTTKDEDGNDVLVYSPKLSDFEVFKAERRRGMFGKTNSGLGFVNQTFSQAWNVATLGFLSGGAKGAMQRRRTLDMHVETLNRYDSDISTTRDEVKDLEIKIKNGVDSSGNKFEPSEIEALRIELTGAKNQLKALENGLGRYKVKVGSSRKIYGDNPFMRQVIIDDAIIASSIAYGSALLSGSYDIDIGPVEIQKGNLMDPGAAEALTSVVLPLIAPYGVRKAVSATKSVSNFVLGGTIDSAVDTIDAIGSTLHLFPEGTLLTGTDSEIRDAIKAGGLTPTDKTVKGVFTLRKILNAMDPVYRERAYQSLIRYNRTMTGLRSEMVRLELPEEEINENMTTLSLSLAQATGLAPLIAVQQNTLSGGIKVKDLTDGKKLGQVLDNMAAQENVIQGMEININNFIAGIEKSSGIKINDNKPLRDAVNQINGMIEVQRNSVAAQKIAIKTSLDKLYRFAAGEGRIDEDTVERLLDINKGLVPEGELIDNVWTIRAITDIRTRLMEGLEETAEAVVAFHSSMSSRELEVELNALAEDAFDIMMGSRRAKASQPYRDLDDLKDSNGEQIIVNVNDLVGRLRSVVDDFADKPISYALTGGKRFMSQGGLEMQRTMNKVALRGFLNSGIPRQEVSNLLRARRQQLSENNPDFDPSDYTLADLAFEMQAEIKKKIDAGEIAEGVEAPNYLQATVYEAEKIARYFRNQARRFSSTDFEASQSFEKIEQEMDSIFKQYTLEDGTSLFEKVDAARANYRRVMGEPTSPGTYADNVIKNRTYFEALSEQPAGTKGKYKKTSAEGGATPDYIFRDMRKLMSRVLNKNLSDAEFQSDVLPELRAQRDRLLEFFGAEMQTGGYGFDLSDPEQAQVARLLQQLLSATGDAAFSGKLRDELASRVGEFSPFVIGKAEIAKLTEGDMPYNFKFAERIETIENEFKVPVVSSGGSTGNLRLLTSGKTKSFAQDFDTRLQEDVAAVKAFNEVRDDLMNTQGDLRIAAEREVEIERELLARVQKLGDIASDPMQFGKTYFEGSDPEQFEIDVQDFVQKSKATKNPLTEDEVRSFMQYMYTRYLTEKAGIKYKYTPRTGEKREGVPAVSDVTVLINEVARPENRAMMQAILGEDLTRSMEDIADWATYATGDAMSIKGMNAGQLMSLESAFARAFNIARGMVSIPYVATEVSARIALYRNDSLIKMALSDRQLSNIMARMLRKPEELTKADIKTFGIRMQRYIAKELYITGGEVPTVDQIIASISGGYEPSDEGRELPETPDVTIATQNPNEELIQELQNQQEARQ